MSTERPSDSEDYLVGYAKPPENHKFKPGVSGNPQGRPKGSRDVGAVLIRALREQVVIHEGGRRKTITKLEAAVKQLANKAASGDLGASKLMFPLIRPAEEEAEKNMPATTALHETDQKVLQGILKRLESSTTGGELESDK